MTTDSPSAGLEASRISVSLGGRTLVREVSFSVEAGEIFGLFGPSGAGKSTLFRALIGEVRSSGAVRLGDRDLSALPLWRRASAGLGYVPQGPSVLFDLSVRDNLLTFARLAGKPAEAEAWAERAGLGQRLGVRASALSGGERRRLELARALLAAPAALLCDEPFAGLNPASIAQVGALLREAAAAGAAVVISDHHLDQALALARRAALLLDGSLDLCCEAASFASHPLVSERYAGRDR